MKTIEETKKEIMKGWNSYWEHADGKWTPVDAFFENVAKESFKAKASLKNLLRKHPQWNEAKECIIIDGTVENSANFDNIKKALNKVERASDMSFPLLDALRVFCSDSFNEDSEEGKKAIEVLNSQKENAYTKGKKKSRVVKAIFDTLESLFEDANFENIINKQFSIIADELNAKSRNVKLIVSVNPAHFLTMSNPHSDDRGRMLVSCHSLNSSYSYKNGCVGYACDAITMIVFTVNNFDDEESWYNRKTSRQLFMYKPDSKVLLQSRMYDSAGGTTGRQPASKPYREIVQKIISDCEEKPNLWRSFNYNPCREHYEEYPHFEFEEAYNFAGYPDWTFPDFAPMISIRKDWTEDEDERSFIIGAASYCTDCGREIKAHNTNKHMVCQKCLDENDYDKYWEDYDDYDDDDDY